jgi:hypothetical protein
MSFDDWLNTEIDWNGLSRLRRHSIHEFVKGGLVPFLNDRGYAINVSLKFLKNAVATGMYENRHYPHAASEWNYTRIEPEWDTNSLAHFYHVLDEDAWDGFWAKWGGWSDVAADEFRGPDRRQDIQYFIRNCIDLEASSQTQVLYELMNDVEEYDVSARKNGVDTYIQDYGET